MNDDFDTPSAIATLFELARNINRLRSQSGGTSQFRMPRQTLVELAADSRARSHGRSSGDAGDAAPFIDLLIEMRALSPRSQAMGRRRQRAHWSAGTRHHARRHPNRHNLEEDYSHDQQLEQPLVPGSNRSSSQRGKPGRSPRPDRPFRDSSQRGTNQRPDGSSAPRDGQRPVRQRKVAGRTGGSTRGVRRGSKFGAAPFTIKGELFLAAMRSSNHCGHDDAGRPDCGLPRACGRTSGWMRSSSSPGPTRCWWKRCPAQCWTIRNPT